MASSGGGASGEIHSFQLCPTHFHLGLPCIQSRDSATAEELNVDMTSKCGLGILLLAVQRQLKSHRVNSRPLMEFYLNTRHPCTSILWMTELVDKLGKVVLSTFGVWFLPVSSATAEIFLLLSGQTATSTESIRNNTQGGDLDTGHTEHTIFPNSSSVTDVPETSPISGLTEGIAQPMFTASPDILSAANQNSSWSAEETQGAANSTVELNTSKELLSGAEILNRSISSSRNFPSAEELTFPASATTSHAMEISMTACVQATRLTDAEVLAIAIGALFLAIILSSLFYQLVIYLRNKKVNRDSSIYIIQNELHKYDMDSSGEQPETKL